MSSIAGRRFPLISRVRQDGRRPPRVPQGPRSARLRTTLAAYLLLLPGLVIALVFTYYPALYVLRLSLFEWDLISPVQRFAGLDNFRRLLSGDSGFWNSLRRTVEYGALYLPLSLLAGLGLALALTRVRRARGFFQTLYFVPSVTSIAVVSVVWSLIYNPQVGLLNRVLSALGLGADRLPAWLNDPALAIPCLAVMGMWQSLGFVILLFVAGLANIPATLYEAAAIDGAGGWPVFRRITLPLLSPVTFFVVFMLLINSFRLFGAVAIMTRGRPLGSTNVLLYLVYQQAFRHFDAGLAAATSVLVFLLVLGAAVAQRGFGERLVFYG